MTAPAKNAPEVAEHAPTYRMDEQIKRARERMGPERWAELQEEWA